MNCGNDRGVGWVRKLCWSLSQGFLEMGCLERFVHMLFEVGLGRAVAEELKARPAEGRAAALGEGGPPVKGAPELAVHTEQMGLGGGMC